MTYKIRHCVKSLPTLVTFIDKTDPTDSLKREQYWRHTLKKLVSYGLNVSENVWLHDICKLL